MKINFELYFEKLQRVVDDNKYLDQETGEKPLDEQRKLHPNCGLNEEMMKCFN